MWNKKGFIYWLVPFILGIIVGAIFHRLFLFDPVPSTAVPASAQKNFQLMAEAWNAIEQKYVDRPAVEPRTMTYGAIGGMVASLGDTGHSVFLTPEMVKLEGIVDKGTFTGIGAEIQMKDKHVVIVASMDGSPAQKVGLHTGDIILQVNGSDVTGLTLQQVIEKILGPKGTQVSLTMVDPSTGQKRTVTIMRENITVQSVTWSMLPGTEVAHVRIAFFSKGTSRSLEKALAEIGKIGAQGLVLDLRNDPGGLLDMAVGVTSQFLEKGVVLQEKDAKGAVRMVPVESGVPKSSLPLIVLINNGTASAAEIVAGALQDAKRASLVGDTTFGTGTVLNSIPLSDGSALLLAVLEWLTPDGRTIWHKGISPDIMVTLPAQGTQLIPDAEQGMTAAQIRTSTDAQLLRAIRLLQKPPVP